MISNNGATSSLTLIGGGGWSMEYSVLEAKVVQAEGKMDAARIVVLGDPGMGVDRAGVMTPLVLRWSVGGSSESFHGYVHSKQVDQHRTWTQLTIFASGMFQPMARASNQSFRGMSVEQSAHALAASHGFRLVTSTPRNFRESVSQDDRTDWEHLAHLASRYGMVLVCGRSGLFMRDRAEHIQTALSRPLSLRMSENFRDHTRATVRHLSTVKAADGDSGTRALWWASDVDLNSREVINATSGPGDAMVRYPDSGPSRSVDELESVVRSADLGQGWSNRAEALILHGFGVRPGRCLTIDNSPESTSPWMVTSATHLLRGPEYMCEAELVAVDRDYAWYGSGSSPEAEASPHLIRGHTYQQGGLVSGMLWASPAVPAYGWRAS